MAHADYICCACCDSKISYSQNVGSKTSLCESCIKKISDIAGKTISSVSDFQSLIYEFKSSELLVDFLQKVNFKFCFYDNPIDGVVSSKLNYVDKQFVRNNYNKPEPMQIIVLEGEEQIYISDNINGGNLEQRPSRSTPLGSLYVNGKQPELGYANGWYIVDELPKTIQKYIPRMTINDKWVLKDKLKEVMKADYPNIKDVIEGKYFPEELTHISFAYEPCFDSIEEHFEDVEFELITLESEKNYIPKFVSFTPFFGVKDIIKTPRPLIGSKPCAVSGEELYSIIRNYIKKNINPRAAKITSDYDFCFTVEKVIDIEPYTIQVDISRTKKPKYQDKLITNKNVVVYRNSPKGYEKYPKQEDWYANSCNEMEEKIKDYLEDLIKKINTPMKRCPTCNGCGAIEIE